MKVTILFNDEALSPSFAAGWGFSALINETLLFDTGSDGPSLLRNMRLLEKEVRTLRALVISHDHWDHTGALDEILKINNHLTVYGCSGFSRAFKKIVKGSGAYYLEARRGAKLQGSIFTTGQMIGSYKKKPLPEQALILKTRRGISVVAGCAHPGIERVVQHATKLFPREKVYAVIGGFHLKQSSRAQIKRKAERLKEFNPARIAPLHCSGQEAQALMHEYFPRAFRILQAGSSIIV
jgi:7,8-dihydropterin-6-yl-methyl-4-(beta-D-ribofuranosyl)aminobenzene 5'-phosphate synthase